MGFFSDLWDTYTQNKQKADEAQHASNEQMYNYASNAAQSVSDYAEDAITPDVKSDDEKLIDGFGDFVDGFKDWKFHKDHPTLAGIKDTLQNMNEMYAESNRQGVRAEAKVVEGVGSSLYNYGVGAVQGYQEMAREQNRFDTVAEYDGATGKYAPKPGYTQEDVDQAQALLSKASSNFRNETLYPGMMGVGAAVAPPIAAAAFGLQTGEGAYKGAQENADKGAATSLGLGVKSVWLDPLLQTVTDPELGKKMQQNPAAELTNLIMGGVNVAAPILGAYAGVKAATGKGGLKGEVAKGETIKLEAPLTPKVRNIVDGFGEWRKQPKGEQEQVSQPATQLPVAADVEDYAGVKPVVKEAANEFGQTLQNDYGINAEITSGRRSEENNRAVGGAEHSHHLTGDAIDLYVGDISDDVANQILEKAKAAGWGEVLYHDAGTGKHLHLADFQGEVKGASAVGKTGSVERPVEEENADSNVNIPEEEENAPQANAEGLEYTRPIGEDEQRIREADSRVPEESTEVESPYHEEIGLNETPEYSAARGESQAVSDKIARDRQRIEASPDFQSKLNSHLEEARKIIDEKLNESPLYQASDRLDFNLQLFGKDVKDAKEVASKYLADKLDDSQMATVDAIAEEHGFSSGDHLAKEIIKNGSKAEKAKTELEKATTKFKKENLDNREDIKVKEKSNTGTAKAAAIEAETLRGMGRGEHTEAARARKEAEISKRWADAEKDLVLKMEKAKNDEQVKALKSELSDLKKHHKEELDAFKKDSVEADKQRKAEEKQQSKEDRKANKAEWQSAKEWLKAENVSQQLARKADISIAAAKKYVKYEFLGKTLKEAINYKQYANIAQKAARASERAYRKGLYEEAAQWKETELVNHLKTIEAMDYYKFFKKQEKYLKDVKGQKLEIFKTQEHFNQAASLLDRFGFDRNDYDAKGKTETLNQWSDRMNNELSNVNIADWLLDESIKKPYDELTRWELKDVTDAIRNIKKVASNEKRSIAAEKGRLMSEIKGDMLKELNSNVKDSYKPKRKTSIEQAKRGMNGLAYELETIDTIVRKMQGWETFGAFEKFFIRSAHERANLESIRMNEISTKLKEIFHGEFGADELKKMDRNLFREEVGVSCSDKDLMAIALNYGNEGNRAKIVKTRPLTFADAKKWDEPTILSLLQNNLTEKQWKAVQKITDTINSLWPDVAKFNEESSGFAPDKVEASPYTVTTKDGKTVNMDGGYYPLRQDPESTLQSAQLADVQGPIYNEYNGGAKSVTKNGYTRQRTGKDYAVDLDLSVINRHVTEVVHDLYFRDLIADFRRMIKDEDFQNAVRIKLGPEGLKAISDYVVNVANGEAYKNVGMSAYDKVMNIAKRKAGSAAVLGRLSVLVQNLANIALYPKAIKDFGYGDAMMGLMKEGLCNYTSKALTYYPAALKIRDEVYKLSPFMRDRQQSPDYAIIRAQEEIFKKNGITGNVREFLSGLMTYTDDLIAIPMWKQAFKKEFARTGDQKQAVYYADTLIKSVNGSGRTQDLSLFMRSKNGTTSILNSFYGFFNTMHNRFIQEKGMLQKNPLTGSPRFAGYLAAQFVIFPVLSDIISGKGPGENEDAKKYWAKEIVTSPLQMFPVVRDFAPLALDYMMGIKAYSNRTPLVLSGIEAATTIAKKVASPKATKQDVAEAITKTAAYTIGYPDQFNAWFWNLYDYAANGVKPEVADVFKRVGNEREGEKGLKNQIIADLKDGNTLSLQNALQSGEISPNKYKEIMEQSRMNKDQLKVNQLDVEKAIEYYNNLPQEQKDTVRNDVAKKIQSKLNNPQSMNKEQREKLQQLISTFR